MTNTVISIEELQRRRRDQSSTARLLQLDEAPTSSKTHATIVDAKGNESTGLPFLNRLKELAYLRRADIVASLSRCNELLSGLLNQPDRSDELAVRALKKVIADIEMVIPRDYRKQLLVLARDELKNLQGPVAELAVNLRVAYSLLKATNVEEQNNAPRLK